MSGPGTTRAYTRGEWHRAVWCAVLAGWAIVTAPVLVQMPALLFYAAVLGLPVSAAACWLVGAPILWRLMARPVGWARAALWGGGIGAAMGAVTLALGNVLWPASATRLGGADDPLMIDGRLTASGWQAAGVGAMVLVAIGMAVSLIVRAAIGPGRRAGR